ncbi:branched-chain amino acid ABC transporter permease [Propionivibrio sp.]|uniref:branched-chain amino acid ABC transporter permease n=1 Tax=Propionivibrio sp. TaxID=2212460 RepID=UPI002603325E|nr:branched-chain amino acid ABC transporter permease [Propionivibrio sp.]
MGLYESSKRRRVAAAITLASLLALPWLITALDQGFYISFASRVLIFALAATSLNLVIGFGGMISFGHAAFFGTGAYCVAVLAESGIVSAALAWPLTMALTALLALLIGAISLRTRGVYFIMITLAFAQMVFYLVVSLKAWGGDDGLSLVRRSIFGGLDLKDDTTFYFVVLAILALVLVALDRLAHSRFGRVIQSIRENETRMEALGYPVFAYKLVCFVIGGALAGLAGALLVNQSGLASPNLLHWMQSGTLMVMIVLGGVGSVYGGVVGAVLLLLGEEILAEWVPHWPIGLGVLLLAVVLWAPLGIAGLFGWGRSRE